LNIRHLIAACLACAAAAVSAQPVFTSQDLGVGDPLAMSSDGRWVAGYARAGAADVAVWQDGQMRSVIGPGGGSAGSVAGINAQGDLVTNVFGEVALFPGGVYNEATYQVFHLGPGTFFSSEAFGVNDAGQVVGTGYDGFNFQGFVRQADGSLQALPNVEGYGNSLALGINASGVVVGSSWQNSTRYSQATLWRGGVATSLSSYFGANAFTVAVDIANGGQIIGTGFYRNESEPGFNWLLDQGVVYDLGDFVPVAVNSQGQVIGKMGGTFDVNGFWSRETGAVYLGSLLAQDDPIRMQTAFSRAVAINDQGQILVAADIEGTMHAAILSSVPEPGTGALMVLGVLGAMAAYRRPRLGAVQAV
jgi:uncharacterized membrane protein